MLPELRKSLKNDFPFLLGGPWENHLGDSSGWEPLIRELAFKICQPLEFWWAECDEANQTELGPPRITRLAVEPGGLRVFMTWIPKDLDVKITKIINQIEQKSFEICIDCGQSGTLRVEDEIVTLCDDCAGVDDDDEYDSWDDLNDNEFMESSQWNN